MENTIEQIGAIYIFGITYNKKEYEVQTDDMGNVTAIHPALPSTKTKEYWPELHTEIKNWVEYMISENQVASEI